MRVNTQLCAPHLRDGSDNLPSASAGVEYEVVMVADTDMATPLTYEALNPGEDRANGFWMLAVGPAPLHATLCHPTDSRRRF